MNRGGRGSILECLINVTVHVLISRKMPNYMGPIWHYTFIKKIKMSTQSILLKYIHLSVHCISPKPLQLQS